MVVANISTLPSLDSNVKTFSRQGAPDGTFDISIFILMSGRSSARHSQLKIFPDSQWPFIISMEITKTVKAPTIRKLPAGVTYKQPWLSGCYWYNTGIPDSQGMLAIEITKTKSLSMRKLPAGVTYKPLWLSGQGGCIVGIPDWQGILAIEMTEMKSLSISELPEGVTYKQLCWDMGVPLE